MVIVISIRAENGYTANCSIKNGILIKRNVFNSKTCKKYSYLLFVVVCISEDMHIFLLQEKIFERFLISRQISYLEIRKFSLF